MAAIMNERQKELFMEGDRWFELKRNGRPEFWVQKTDKNMCVRSLCIQLPYIGMTWSWFRVSNQNPGYE